MQTSIVPQWDNLPDLTWKEKVAYMTYELLQKPQAECPVEHFFQPGKYIREMRIPAGAVFIGRAHRYGHECRLVSGMCVWVTEEGKRLAEAPVVIHTTPGTHMVLLALTDLIGQTIHPNPHESRDTQQMEDDIFESVEALKSLGASLHQRLGNA